MDTVEKVKTTAVGVMGQAKTTIFELVGQKHLRSLKQTTHFGLIVCWIIVYLTHLSFLITKHGIGASWAINCTILVVSAIKAAIKRCSCLPINPEFNPVLQTRSALKELVKVL